MSHVDPIYAEARTERLVELAVDRNRLDSMDDEEAMAHIGAMAMLDADAIVLVLSGAAEAAMLMLKVALLVESGASVKGTQS